MTEPAQAGRPSSTRRAILLPQRSQAGRAFGASRAMAQALLGLVVDLNQVHLTITAQQGSGNLLGNLLCAVANLLNNNGGTTNALQQITNLLNQILAQL